MKKIQRFEGQYRFLSNFYIEPDGSCVEVEYQGAKCASDNDRLKLLDMTPGQAKRFGRAVKLVPNWDEIKLPTMARLVRQKFADHADLREALLDTGTAILEEGNWWGDRFWGICNGTGENHLGKILMDVRRDLIDFAKCPKEGQ